MQIEMDVRIFNQEDELAAHAATWCAGATNKAIRHKGGATIILSSEVSQIPFLEHFASRQVDWSKVACFQLCELSGLGREDPRSFSNILQDKLTDRVQPALKACYLLNGLCDDDLPQYEALLQQADIDLVCAGIGNDGSVGFVQPHGTAGNDAQTPSEQSNVTADGGEQTGACSPEGYLMKTKLGVSLKHQMVEEGKYHGPEEVPGHGTSVALSVLQRATSVCFVVPDINKADAVSSSLLETVGRHCPASMFRQHKHGVMWLSYHSALTYLDRTRKKNQYAMVKIPGLVDLQVMGYRGVDFTDMSLTEEKFRTSCRQILATGLAVFLPTLITSSMSVYERNIPIMVRVMLEEEFHLRIPGLHLDGPFICRDDGVSSCHHGLNILDPDRKVLDHLLGLCQGKLLLLTLAADLNGAVELANYASAQGVCVSLGHQMASSVEIRHLVRVGARMLTHFGNGVPMMVNRQNNPLWPGLVEDNLMAAIITDGHHLTNDIIKAVLKVKGPDKTIVTSDMTAVTGLSPGHYTLFGDVRIVLEANNAVFLESGEWFAGSAMTALQCANYLLKQELVDIGVIQKICFYNPLRLLGIDPTAILANVPPLIKVTRRGGLDLIDPDGLFS